MAFVRDAALDAALDDINDGTRIDICASEPANYAAISGVSLGNKTGLTVGAPADGDTSGRKVTVPAITDGSVTADGTAAFWALSNGSDTLYATGAINPTQAVTNGNEFSLTAIDIEIADAADE